MKALVTGAGGFIGSHLVAALAKARHEVTALVHYNARGHWGHLNDLSAGLLEKVTVQLGDVTDSAYIRGAVSDCDVVYHLAALIGIPYSYAAPESYVRTNIQGTLNVLEACRSNKVRRVIVTSTSEVYGTACYTPMDEKHPLQAQSPYSASKIAADKLAESYYRSFDLPVVVLRPFNTYGPRQSARAIIPTVMVQALSGSQEIRLGNLTPKRDLTFVEDTAQAFLVAGEAEGIEGEVIHFGQGTAISIGDLAQRCLEAVGSKATVVEERARHRPVNSEVELLLCDATKARDCLRWSPKTELDEGLTRVAEYIKTHLSQYRSAGYII